MFFYLINECCCLKKWLSSLLVPSHTSLSLICSINFVVRSGICLTSLCVGSQERVGAAEQACPFWCRQRTGLSVWWASTLLLCSGMGSLWEPQHGSGFLSPCHWEFSAAAFYPRNVQWYFLKKTESTPV